MKKVFTLLMVVTLSMVFVLFSACSCGKNKDNNTDDSTYNINESLGDDKFD